MVENKLLDADADLAALRDVAVKGEKLYNRTRSAASAQSVHRAKQLATSRPWSQLHPLFAEQGDAAAAQADHLCGPVRW